ncbi:hypothetical protein EYR97_12675 [Alteromonas sp. KUL42]|uniref:hypothetical protein n=1 Tax=Alteromonas sp. KUL42 TaxID=2480797 RepID=UPI00103606C8|nr:hypothetical protein [Alteromonas sp. KUL42]TAP34404.1 hypothetical protein EYR97_12675 [Alteromonas sp. KUL42]
MKNYAVFVAITFMLVGCVSFQPTQLDVQPSTNVLLEVIDKRPLDQKETEMLSYLITSCDYGIQRLGDEWTTPDKVEFLKSHIGRLFPNAKSLVIDNFVIYNNMQYQLREGNIYRGPIWSLVECNESTDKFTMYTPEENPERFNMLIGTFEGSIDGNKYSIRAAEIPVCPDGMKTCNGLVSRNNAITKILNSIVAQIAKGS